MEQIRKDTDSEIEKKLASRRGLGGALGRWAAGGSSVTKPLLTPEEELEKAKKEAVGMVRESVIWYLRRKLEDVVEFQRNMMETRVQREVERGKSVLYKVNAGNNKFAGGGSVISPTSPTKDIFADVNGGLRERDSRGKVALDEYDRKQAEQSLSPDQLQIFEKENNEMLKHYEDTLSQVR